MGLFYAMQIGNVKVSEETRLKWERFRRLICPHHPPYPMQMGDLFLTLITGRFCIDPTLMDAYFEKRYGWKGYDEEGNEESTRYFIVRRFGQEAADLAYELITGEPPNGKNKENEK